MSGRAKSAVESKLLERMIQMGVDEHKLLSAAVGIFAKRHEREGFTSFGSISLTQKSALSASALSVRITHTTSAALLLSAIVGLLGNLRVLHTTLRSAMEFPTQRAFGSMWGAQPSILLTDDTHQCMAETLVGDRVPIINMSRIARHTDAPNPNVACAPLDRVYILYPWDPKVQGFNGMAQWLVEEKLTTLQWIPSAFRQFIRTVPEALDSRISESSSWGESYSRCVR